MTNLRFSKCSRIRRVNVLKFNLWGFFGQINPWVRLKPPTRPEDAYIQNFTFFRENPRHLLSRPFESKKPATQKIKISEKIQLFCSKCTYRANLMRLVDFVYSQNAETLIWARFEKCSADFVVAYGNMRKSGQSQNRVLARAGPPHWKQLGTSPSTSNITSTRSDYLCISALGALWKGCRLRGRNRPFWTLRGPT